MAKRQRSTGTEEGSISMSEEARTAAIAAATAALPEPAVAPVAVAEGPEPTAIDPDTRAAVLELMKDPDIARGLLDTVLQTPEGRAQLNIPLDQGRPMGEYRRNYDAEPHLRVYGGVEVRHDGNFSPRPPSNVPMYVSISGGSTDHVEPVYKDMVDVSGRLILEEDGRTARQALVAEGAQLDDAGMPVKTEGYKAWIDSKITGRRLDSNVRADIAAGKDLGAEGHFAGDGIPSFVNDDGGVPLHSAG